MPAGLFRQHTWRQVEGDLHISGAIHVLRTEPGWCKYRAGVSFIITVFVKYAPDGANKDMHTPGLTRPDRQATQPNRNARAAVALVAGARNIRHRFAVHIGEDVIVVEAGIWNSHIHIVDAGCVCIVGEDKNIIDGTRAIAVPENIDDLLVQAEIVSLRQPAARRQSQEQQQRDQDDA